MKGGTCWVCTTFNRIKCAIPSIGYREQMRGTSVETEVPVFIFLLIFVFSCRSWRERFLAFFVTWILDSSTVLTATDLLSL